MPYYGPRKYAPLTTYLTGLTADELTLAFGEIEAILGTTLPPSAGTSLFWVNVTDSLGRSVQAQAWRRAGWRVLRTDLRRDMPAVTFVRAP
jgi:hypothetical protein